MSTEVECGRGGCPSPENFFCLYSDKFECILPQILRGRKHGQLLKIYDQTGGGAVAPSPPPPLNTPLFGGVFRFVE